MQYINNKIDLIIDSLAKGGAERICVTYANYLSSIGYKVRIILFRNSDDSYQDDLSKEIEVFVIGCKNSIHLCKSLISSKVTISNTVISFNHQISVSLLTYRSLANKKFKIIARNVNYLSQDVNYKKVGFKSIFTRFFIKRLYNKMDLYISQCQEMKDDMVSYLNIDPSKIIVIYNPVSEKISYDSNIKNKYDILFVGRLSPQKGIEYLHDILRKVIDKKNNLSICIIGKSGSEYGDDKINKILSLNGINKSEIDYIQSTNDMSYYYNSSKMCVLTSVYEGFPNVLNESIKCCTPVISFDCKSGPSEIINDNNGILIKQYDIDGFVNAIINMLTNPMVIKETPYKSPLQKLVKILGNNHVYK